MCLMFVLQLIDLKLPASLKILRLFLFFWAKNISEEITCFFEGYFFIFAFAFAKHVKNFSFSLEHNLYACCIFSFNWLFIS